MSGTGTSRRWAGVLGTAFFPFMVLVLSGTMGLGAQQQEAKEQFQKLCASCHGTSGRGDGPAAVALTPRPLSFADSAFQASRTDEQLNAAITNGKPPMMPGFSRQLSPSQVQALVAHIRQLGKSAK